MNFIYYEHSNKKSINIRQLCNLFVLTKEHAQKIYEEDLKIAIANSNVVITLSDNDIIIGFSRATSDAIYRAVIWDLIVHPKYQKLGIEKKLVKATLSHNLVSKVERVYFMKTYQKQFFYKQVAVKNNRYTTMTWCNSKESRLTQQIENVN